MAERMSMGEAAMLFTADDIQFQRTAANVQKTMAGVAKEMKSSAEDATNSLQKLAKAFVGREIVNQLGEGLRRMGNAAAEMSQKVRLGEASTEQMVLKIAEGIPIIGHFIEAGRGFRELITGELALTAAIERQNAEQLRRVEITKDLTTALRNLRRQQEDLDAKLGKGFGAGSFADRLGDTFRGAGRAIFDATEKATGGNMALLERMRAEIAAQGKTLENLRDTRGGFTSDPLTGFNEDTEGQAMIKEAQDKIDALRNQERTLVAEIENTRRRIVADVTQDTAKATFGLFGDEAAKGIRTVITAIDQLIPRLSPMSSTTKSALESMRSDYDRLNDALKDYRDNLERNAIVTDQFAKLTTAAIVKVVRPIDVIAAKIREAMSPLNTLGFNLKATFDRIVGGPVPRKPDAPFKASFVGLSDMGRRIQEAAGGTDPAAKLAEQQLKEQQKANQFAKIIADAQQQLIAALPKVGRLK